MRVAKSGFLAAKGIRSYGLYSQRRLLKGYVLGEFLGRILSDQEAKTRVGGESYLFDVKNGRKVAYVIDGADARESSVVRYANSADMLGQQNAAWRQYDGRIYLELIKRVSKGREILTWYGENTSRLLR